MTELRLDKWLWAARLFKTRPLAVKAISGGHVEVNGHRAKPARLVKVGDEVSIRKGPYTYEVTIAGLSDKRGPPARARELFIESEASLRERERLAGELKTRAAQILYDPKRPGSRERLQARTRKRQAWTGDDA